LIIDVLENVLRKNSKAVLGQHMTIFHHSYLLARNEIAFRFAKTGAYNTQSYNIIQSSRKSK
jgi:hypothetical protein